MNRGGLDRKGGIGLCGWGLGLGHGACRRLGVQLGWSLGLRLGWSLELRALECTERMLEVTRKNRGSRTELLGWEVCTGMA